MEEENKDILKCLRSPKFYISSIFPRKLQKYMLPSRTHEGVHQEGRVEQRIQETAPNTTERQRAVPG